MSIRNKKTALFLVLAILASSLCMLMFFDFLLVNNEAYEKYADFIFDIKLLHWGWPFVLIFATSAIAGTLYWKPYNLLFRVITVVLSAIALVLGLLWLFIYILGATFPT